MNILERLHVEHNMVKELCEKILQSDSSKINELSEDFNRLYTEIILHTEAEEEVFYSRLSNAQEDIDDLLEHSYEEHEEVEGLLDLLGELDPQEEEWKARFQELRDELNHHIETEETKLFKYAQENFSAEELQKLEQQFRDAKTQYEKSHAA